MDTARPSAPSSTEPDDPATPTTPPLRRPVPTDDRSATEEAADIVSEFLDRQTTRAHWLLLGHRGPEADPARRPPIDTGILGVAVTMGLDGIPSTVGSSTGAAREIDEVQYEIGQGPCLHGLRTGEGRYVPDLGHDDRWGPYGPEAARRGARSCLSMPVLDDGDRPVAVVKVYATEVDGLDDEQRGIGSRLAHEIAGSIGLAHALAGAASELDTRIEVMNTRRVIDLALGVVMHRDGVGPDDAFARLRRDSQDYNVKLRDVARALVYGIAPDAVETVEAAPYRSRRG
ncbi:GAF domain-containing protein [Terracoccus luteus]|uniref:GAF domain-containing protein n=1 Tax=Terracoccus luteus TaxID=53356 RepID=A0A495XYV4_9MICO|nr:GAF and ANTAR domain-containing protein [Terracoccus luteus]RKT79780.1 GAF domain-containing protein [Terracoccus luteus]